MPKNPRTIMSPGVRYFSKIGFLGLGNMGGHMAKNILKKNYELWVYDINRSTLSNLTKLGAKEVSSAAELSKYADAIISMLPSNQHVLNSYMGANGILSSAKKNTLLIDCSTIDPSVSQNIAKEAEKKQVAFVDSPVSGGVNAAKDGVLTFMVGGTKKNFEAAEPILRAMGTNVIHCGTVGMGEAAKLCNNMLLAISMIGTAEAFNLGQKLGLDVQVLARIINSSSGRCWSSELYNPVPGVLENVPSSRNYEGGFTSALMAKDLGLVQSAASTVDAPIPLGSLAYQIYKTMLSHGYSNKDLGVVYKFIRAEK